MPNLLRKTVRPEFHNRVDELIMFRPLSHADVRAIVKLQLHMLIEAHGEGLPADPERGDDRAHLPDGLRSAIRRAPHSA